MKTIRKIALYTLLSFSALSVSSTYCMKDKVDYSKMTEKGYKALAAWVASVNWSERLKIAAAIEKAKAIDWAEVYKWLPWAE